MLTHRPLWLKVRRCTLVLIQHQGLLRNILAQVDPFQCFDFKLLLCLYAGTCVAEDKAKAGASMEGCLVLRGMCHREAHARLWEERSVESTGCISCPETASCLGCSVLWTREVAHDVPKDPPRAQFGWHGLPFRIFISTCPWQGFLNPSTHQKAELSKFSSRNFRTRVSSVLACFSSIRKRHICPFLRFRRITLCGLLPSSARLTSLCH